MTSAAVLSHAFGAAVFFLVALSLSFDKAIRRKQPVLLLSFWSTALWGASSAAFASGMLSSYVFVLMSTILRNALWCLYLGRFLDVSPYREKILWFNGRRFKKAVLLIAGVGAVCALITFEHTQSPKPQYHISFLISQIILCILGLVLVEQLYRNAIREQRTGLVALGISVGALFAFDFYLYASAFFYGPLDFELWQARGGVTGLIAPLLSVFGIWYRDTEDTLSLTDVFAFRSIALFFCASYLFVTAIASFVLKYYAAELSEVVDFIFTLCALFIITVLLLSKSLRNKVRIQINKHLFHYQYDWQEEWSRFSHLLSQKTKQSTLSERVVQAMANMVDSSAGVLFQAEEGSTHFVTTASWGRVKNTQPVILESTIADKCLQSRCVIERNELSQAQREWLDEQWPWSWCLIPLVYGNELEAILCLKKPYTEFSLSWEVLNLLKTAGTQAAVFLAQERNAEALAQARQFEGVNRLSTFLMHDVKNVTMQLSMLLSNAERHRENPAFFDSMLKTIKISVRHLQQMMAQLNTDKKNFPASSETFDMLPIIQSVLAERADTTPKPTLTLADNLETLWVKGDPTQFRRIIKNLVNNAQEATPRDGAVSLALSKKDKEYILTIEDTGCGMSAAFVKEGLFTPFVTTKGSYGMGVGVYEAKTYLQSVGGTIGVQSVPEKGTTFSLTIPEHKIVVEAMA